MGGRGKSHGCLKLVFFLILITSHGIQKVLKSEHLGETSRVAPGTQLLQHLRQQLWTRENILGSCGLCMRGAGTEARERYPHCRCRWGHDPWGILLYWGVSVALYLFTKLLHYTRQGLSSLCSSNAHWGALPHLLPPLWTSRLDHEQQMASLNLPTGDSKTLQTRLTRIKKDSLTKNCI